MRDGEGREDESRGKRERRCGLCSLMASPVCRARRIQDNHHNMHTHKEKQVTYSDGRTDDWEGCSRRVPNTP